MNSNEYVTVNCKLCGKGMVTNIPHHMEEIGICLDCYLMHTNYDTEDGYVVYLAPTDTSKK